MSYEPWPQTAQVHFAVAVFIAASIAACNKTSSSPEPSASVAAAASSSAPTGRYSCKAARALPGSETEYDCPDPASASKCSAGNVTACTPTGRLRGSIPPGGKCLHPLANASEAAKFELSDDCAPHPTTASPRSPKGSVCVMESGPGAYCTHDCANDVDCQDLVRAGFKASCFGGSCSLSE